MTISQRLLSKQYVLLWSARRDVASKLQARNQELTPNSIRRQANYCVYMHIYSNAVQRLVQEKQNYPLGKYQMNNELQQGHNGYFLLQLILKGHYMCQFFDAVLGAYIPLK